MRAALERLLHPAYSTCGNCHRPWATVDEHVIPIGAGGGVFAWCENCHPVLEYRTALAILEFTYLEYWAHSKSWTTVRWAFERDWVATRLLNEAAP